MRSWPHKLAAVLALLGSIGVACRAQSSGSGCHGTDGKGKEALKTQDLASTAVQNMSDAELTSITDGKGKMPAYGKSLKPDQVKDLVAYIRSLVKK
jgi:mono/diheme cytochrome c family protein